MYNKSNNLSKWYKKIRIDSFSKGSVLVDYFVELTDLSQDLNTLEIKRMFHDALRIEVPLTVIPLNNGDDGGDEANEDDDDEEMMKVEENGAVKPSSTTTGAPPKSSARLGKFVLDPLGTDFIGIFIFNNDYVLLFELLTFFF